MSKFLSIICIFLLLSCAVNNQDKAVTANLDEAELLARIAQLPGAQLAEATGISFSYPDSVLFAAGAVLPLPGGPELLDPLSRFFRENSGLFWQVDVRAVTVHGAEYDRLLAEKRSELLKRYLLSNGVSLARITFNPLAAEGHPVGVSLILPNQAEKQLNGEKK